jgi:hypothetical protein
VSLVCSGEWKYPISRDTFSIIVDIDNKTITYQNLKLHITIAGDDRNEIWADNPGFVSGGVIYNREIHLDRVAGNILLMKGEDPRFFYGICKPAQKLF